MSLESVRAHFSRLGLEVPILITAESTATVALAAAAHGVPPGRIAKTLAFRLSSGQVLLLVAAGDVRVDHGLFKQVFGKGKMLGADDVVALTGHPVGGVCPFGLASELPIYLDESLRAHEELLPAAGSIDSAVRISTALLAEITQGQWVRVCTAPPATV